MKVTKRSWILVGVAAILVILAFSLLGEYLFIGSSQPDLTKPWMFKGAYAKYSGQIDSVSVPYNLTEEREVTDLNASYVAVLTNTTIETSFLPPFSDVATLWINKSNITFYPQGETLARIYNSQITVEGIGTRSCTVYVCTNPAINTTYYIDNAFVWPLKIVYTTEFQNGAYTLELTLNETNIKGL